MNLSLQKTLGVPFSKFFRDLYKEITEDDIFNGAASLAYYLMLAIFPAMIFLLSMLPYLPIENLDKEIMQFIGTLLPKQAATMFSDVVEEVTSKKSGGLLSFGILATIWAASAGMHAVMNQLNKTYDVKEARPFWKARIISILLTFVFGLLVIGAFALIMFGGKLEEYIAGIIGEGNSLLLLFRAFKWVVVFAAMLLAFALIYYYGPNADQKFQFVTPGSVVGVLLLYTASLAFRAYIDNFSDYAATYGSIGAVIILMLWLYISGMVILLGSEINALIEHYHPEGKNKGEKVKGDQGRERSEKTGPIPSRGRPQPV